MRSHPRQALTEAPRSADFLVLGGGTSGAAVAGLLAQQGHSVVLLEAGPDYGAFGDGRWPAELLDASQLPLTHEWGYTALEPDSGRSIAVERARVIGGCSAHNGCQIALGHRADYDGWAADGNHGWSTEDLIPFAESAQAHLRVRDVAEHELTPFHQTVLDAMIDAGIPRVKDLNDLDEDFGVAPNPVNAAHGLRWNAAFAYLDEARDSGRLSVVGQALVDRLVIKGDRVIGARVLVDGRLSLVRAERVIICAGVYGSPAILLRSGIGDPYELSRIGIRPVHALPGVGRNLQDHAAIALRYSGTPELELRSRAFASRCFYSEEQLIAKVPSSACATAFDLHLYTQGGARRSAPDLWIWELMAAVLTPRSRGDLRLDSANPEAPPLIDHAFLSDPEGHDLQILTEGFERLREIAAQPALAQLLGAEVTPGPAIAGPREVARELRRSVVHAYHPVGTCKMGPGTDAGAVVDPRAQIHGLTGGFVADASIMPTIPRANTNLPAAIIGERVASLLHSDPSRPLRPLNHAHDRATGGNGEGARD